MKRLKITGGLLLTLYLIGCTVLYFFQDEIIFRPSPLPADYQFRMAEEVSLEVEDGIALHALWLKEPDSKGVILYLHGNRGSNRRCLRQTRGMRGHKHDIFMIDYRGYGKSGGKIRSEAKLYADVQKAYDFLKQHYFEDRIVILGYSLGTGMATYLAAHNDPQQLVLVAPYLSMIDLKDRWVPFIPDFLIKYPLKSSKWLPQIKKPISLFHGTEDQVIPYDSSKKLQALNSEFITLFTLQGEGHRGALFNSSFERELNKLLLGAD